LACKDITTSKCLKTKNTVNEKSFTVRKLLWFSWIFRKPQKFSLLNFAMQKVYTVKNFEIFKEIFHSSGEESGGFLPRD